MTTEESREAIYFIHDGIAPAYTTDETICYRSIPLPGETVIGRLRRRWSDWRFNRYLRKLEATDA